MVLQLSKEGLGQEHRVRHEPARLREGTQALGFAGQMQIPGVQAGPRVSLP